MRPFFVFLPAPILHRGGSSACERDPVDPVVYLGPPSPRLEAADAWHSLAEPFARDQLPATPPACVDEQGARSNACRGSRLRLVIHTGDAVMSIKTYRIIFMVKVQQYIEVVQGYAPHDAIRILTQRYPGATSFRWEEVR